MIQCDKPLSVFGFCVFTQDSQAEELVVLCLSGKHWLYAMVEIKMEKMNANPDFILLG